MSCPILLTQLQSIVKDEQEASNLYSFFETASFQEMFYTNESYKQNPSDYEGRINDQGEPQLFFNERLKRWYFLDRFNEPVYYPFGDLGLKRLFPDNNDIKELASNIAFEYFSKNFSLNKDYFEFEEAENLDNLKTFVENFLDELENELSLSKNLADRTSKKRIINISKKYVEEWVEEVQDIFNTFKLKLSFEEEFDNLQEEEDVKGDSVVRKDSHLVDTKKNVNNNIKLFLNFIPSASKTRFNRPKFQPFRDVYKTLNQTLADITPTFLEGSYEDEFEIYHEAIKNLVKDKPYLDFIVKELNNATEIFKNQFVAAFRLHKNNFLTSSIATEKKDYSIDFSYSVKNVSEVGSLQNNILNNWTNNLLRKEYTVKDIVSLEKELNELISFISKSNDTLKSAEKTIAFIEKLGIGLNNQKGFDYFLDQQYGEFSGQQRFLQFTSILNRLLKELKKEPTKAELIQDQTTIKNLAKAQAFFLEEGSDSSVYTMGKTKWVYSLPSYLSNKINSWKKNPDNLRKLFESNPFTNSSHYMKYLLAENIPEKNRRTESIKRINELQLAIFNSYQVEESEEGGVDTKSITGNDMFNDYINKILLHRKNNSTKSWHKTNLAADKSTEYQIHFGNAVNLNDVLIITKNGNVSINNETLEIFYNYFVGEYARIEEAFEDIEIAGEELSLLTPNYHLGPKNALKIHLFPSFSPVYDAKTGEILEQPKINLGLFDESGKPNYSTNKLRGKNIDFLKTRIKKEIETILLNNIDMHFERLFEKGVFTFDGLGNVTNNSIDKDIWKNYLSSYGSNKFNTAKAISADSLINSIISQVEYGKMFVGDVAYYKSMEDFKKRVPATYTDGIYMRLKENELNFNIQVIDSIETNVPYYESFKEAVGEKIAKKYNKTNLADAQAWITPQRWRFIMERLGKWSPIHESAYTKMQSDKLEKFTDKEKKVLGQPLKGVYFDLVEGKPVFLKYSQAVLWKPLIKGTALENVYNKMVQDKNGKELPFNSQTHELITKDGIKVGYPKPNKIHNDAITLLNNFDLGVRISLNNNSWKLQQDLPVKGLKNVPIGSQIQKIIFQGLNYSNDLKFEYKNKQISNKELAEIIHSLHSELSNKGIKDVIKKFGLNSEKQIVNEDEFIYSLIDQLSKRDDVPNNLINALKAYASPYSITGFVEMFNNVFSSAINKGAVKIDSLGGGFIQMSDFGIGKEDLGQNQNIMFTPWMNKEKLPTVEIYEKDGRKKVKPSGIFISGSLISKIFPTWSDYKGREEELFGTYNSETDMYEGGKIDYKILQNIIGYRIPNQGLSSNDSLQILGILPDAVGDTIIPYTGLTVKTGSDFDIDKMYIMFPSVKTIHKEELKLFKSLKEKNGLTPNIVRDILKEEGLSTSGDIYKTLYDYISSEIENIKEEDFEESAFVQKYKNLYNMFDTVQQIIENEPIEKIKYYEPLFYIDEQGNKVEYPLFLQPKKALQNNLIEAYKSVLTQPDLLPEIFKPLDGDNIKNDIVNKFPSEKRKDTLDFDAFSDIDLKQEFLQAKFGLGQNVNSLTHSAVTATSNIEIDNYVLDKQFSNELSEADLKEYQKFYNSRIEKQEDALTDEDLKNIKKLSLADTMTEFINAFVDVAKDSYISRGNWSLSTNPVGFLLIRSGVHPFQVNAFIGQPIIKKYLEFLNKNNSQLTVFKNRNKFNFFKFLIYDDFKVTEKQDILFKDTLYNSKQIAFKFLQQYNTSDFETILTNYNEANINRNIETFLKESNLDNINDINKIKNVLNIVNSKIKEMSLMIPSSNKKPDISFKKLHNNLENNILDPSIIFAFEEIQNSSKKLNTLINGLKITVNGKGKNNVNTLISQNLIEITKEKFNEDQKFQFKNAKNTLNGTFYETMYKNSIEVSREIANANPKYFITGNTLAFNTYNYISQVLKNEPLLREDLGNMLENHYYNYVLQGFDPFFKNRQNKINIMINFPKEFNEMKSKYLKNKLFTYLYPVKGNDLTILGLNNNGKLLPSEVNDLVNAWNDLFKSEPDFAEKMVLYSFYQSSFTPTQMQFHKFIPYQWFNKNRFNSYIKKLNHAFNKKYGDGINTDFADQFFRNNLNSSLFNNKSNSLKNSNNLNEFSLNGKKIDKSLGFYITSEFFEKQKVSDYIEVKLNENEDFDDDFNIVEEDLFEDEMVDMFDFEGGIEEKYFYKREGILEQNGKKYHIYMRLEPLGYKDKKGIRSLEYYPLNENSTSFNKNTLKKRDYLKEQKETLKNQSNFTNVNTVMNLTLLDPPNSTTALDAKHIDDLVTFYKFEKLLPRLKKEYTKEEEIPFMIQKLDSELKDFKQAIQEFETVEEVLNFLNC